MKQHVKTVRQRQLLILVTAFMITLATAFAQDTGEETTRTEIKENFDTSKSTLNGTRQTMRNNEEILLQVLLQVDSASKTELTAQKETCDSNVCELETP